MDVLITILAIALLAGGVYYLVTRKKNATGGTIADGSGGGTGGDKDREVEK